MYLFTSESVGAGHPDKVADAISDTVLDMLMTHRDDSMRCACETMVTTNRVILAGEFRGALDPTLMERAVRQRIREIGYEQPGFDHRNVEITNLMHAQSADIALGTDTFGAGDQGLMFGYACRETEFYMPSAIYWSHQIMKSLEKLRLTGQIPWLGPDAKAQVTFAYLAPNQPDKIKKIVCSTQHSDSVSIDIVRTRIEQAIRDLVPSNLIDGNTQFFINPTGRFVTGGPHGDCGVTGRKIIVDTYGGYAPHGGGAFSGKDPTKVDRSAAYMMRYIAKNIVSSGRASWAQCQVSYAIGVSQPMSFTVDSDGDNHELTTWVLNHVDLSPRGIIDRFDLFRPIYSQTTNYGHFGKPGLPWEREDLF